VARDYLFMCSDPGQELIEAAREEGIEFVNLAAPGKVITENGRGIECVKNELGPPDDSGRRRPVPIEGSEYVIDCDMIIPAIGQKAETALIIKDTDIDLTPWEHSMLTIPPCRHQTSDISAGSFCRG